MRTLTTAVFFIIANLAFSQTIFTVDSFSRDYYGKISIDDTTEVFSKGHIMIFERKTHKQIIKVSSDELALNLHDDKVVANIKELSYGEQSLIMYNDYNFDGIKDFAIEDGQNSCYHGPSFQIYLATATGFKSNADFTRLAQEYCGMFEINSKEKKINTMTKSGCCWHQFSEFIVENNRPKAIKIIENDQSNFPFLVYSEEKWNGKKMEKNVRRTIDLEQEGIKVVLSFRLEKNGKQIVLYINDNTLNYAIIQKDSSVEFSYPGETTDQNSDFRYNQTGNTIIFQNKASIYKIYNAENSIGIEVTVNSKKYNLAGDLNTKKGDLKNVLLSKPGNVVIN